MKIAYVTSPERGGTDRLLSDIADRLQAGGVPLAGIVKDFAYANAYGATGHRVGAADELLPLLEQCYQSGGVHLVDVPVDYSENVRLLVDDLQKPLEI